MKLDFRAIFEIPLRNFVPWLGAVALVTLAGYPGVVCVTPLAWLLALNVGSQSVMRSKSEQSSSRLTEAALAGAILGLLQGILFVFIVPLMGPLREDEQARMTLLNTIFLAGGLIAGAALSFFTAFMSEQRRRREKQSPVGMNSDR